MMMYLEVESKNSNWAGRIFIKVIRETKTQYITSEFPKFGLRSGSIRDRNDKVIRWNKDIKNLHDEFYIKHIHNKIPNVDPNKIYE